MKKSSPFYPLLILLLPLVLLTGGPANGQIMYPGDINNNGIVNGVDVLYLGVAFGFSGPGRNNATTDFVPQPITPWAQFFPNGINYAYADVDGGGEVDEEDLEEDDDDEGLKANFLFTHGSLQPDPASPAGLPGIDPRLQLVPDLPSASAGQTVNIDINLGSGTEPAIDFYGLSFTLEYDPGIIDPANIQFNFESNPWYDPTGNNALKLAVSEIVPGRLDVAIARTNQAPISGSGKLGALSIVIVEDVVGAIFVNDNLEISHALMADVSLEPLPLVLGDGVVSPTTTGVHVQNNPNLKVFPNPADNIIWIETGAHQIQELRLVNPLGQNQPALCRQVNPAHAALDISRLPAGLYLLIIRTPDGVFSRPILIQRE